MSTGVGGESAGSGRGGEGEGGEGGGWRGGGENCAWEGGAGAGAIGRPNCWSGHHIWTQSLKKRMITFLTRNLNKAVIIRIADAWKFFEN